MALHKSEKGRAALLERPADMGLLERRTLILVDGKRDRQQLLAMLGPDVLSGLERLLREGYLVDPAAGKPVASKPVLSVVAPTQASMPAADAPVARVAASVAAPRPASPSRRSLAAAKMYMVDMLQLQRDPESVSLKAELQTSPGEDELVHRLGRSLRHLRTVASSSYAQRIGERLSEILPEAHLPRLAEIANVAPAALESVA